MSGRVRGLFAGAGRGRGGQTAVPYVGGFDRSLSSDVRQGRGTMGGHSAGPHGRGQARGFDHVLHNHDDDLFLPQWRCSWGVLSRASLKATKAGNVANTTAPSTRLLLLCRSLIPRTLPWLKPAKTFSKGLPAAISLHSGASYPASQHATYALQVGACGNARQFGDNEIRQQDGAPSSWESCRPNSPTEQQVWGAPRFASQLHPGSSGSVPSISRRSWRHLRTAVSCMARWSWRGRGERMMFSLSTLVSSPHLFHNGALPWCTCILM